MSNRGGFWALHVSVWPQQTDKHQVRLTDTLFNNSDSNWCLSLTHTHSLSLCSENYLVRWGDKGLPKDIEMLNSLKVVFTVSRIQRSLSATSEKTKKHALVNYNCYIKKSKLWNKKLNYEIYSPNYDIIIGLLCYKLDFVLSYIWLFVIVDFLIT